MEWPTYTSKQLTRDDDGWEKGSLARQANGRSVRRPDSLIVSDVITPNYYHSVFRRGREPLEHVVRVWRSASGYSKSPPFILPIPRSCASRLKRPLCVDRWFDRSAARNNEYYRKMRRFPWYYNISWRDRIGARVPATSAAIGITLFLVSPLRLSRRAQLGQASRLTHRIGILLFVL